MATLHASVLNKTDHAAPLGMSVPGIDNWLDILEATGLIMLVLPYLENFGKRLIKTGLKAQPLAGSRLVRMRVRGCS